MFTFFNRLTAFVAAPDTDLAIWKGLNRPYLLIIVFTKDQLQKKLPSLGLTSPRYLWIWFVGWEWETVLLASPIYWFIAKQPPRRLLRHAAANGMGWLGNQYLRRSGVYTSAREYGGGEPAAGSPRPASYKDNSASAFQVVEPAWLWESHFLR